MNSDIEAVTNNRKVVFDTHGNDYELRGLIGRGGQGTVYKTGIKNVLIKIGNKRNPEQDAKWEARIKSIMRQPLEKLNIARPVALIVKPRFGYIMELMDGLEPLNALMQLTADQGAEGYKKTGSIQRRLRILARLARILAELHGRGLAYGDLSPSNIFISSSIENAEVWLIDPDNIEAQTREGTQKIWSPDYGAPEIIRADSGINTLTDSWSFAVIAFQLMTLVHPLKGSEVDDGDPDNEEAALRGEMPWIDHPTDKRNQQHNGIPRDKSLSKNLRELFERNFNVGMADPGQRPSLSEWATEIELAAENCIHCESCGSTFFRNSKSICSFCDHLQDPKKFLLMQEEFWVPEATIRECIEDEDISNSIVINPNACRKNTGKTVVASKESIKIFERFCANDIMKESEEICEISITDSGLKISPKNGGKIYLQRLDSKPHEISKESTLNFSKQTGKSGWLHLGSASEPHAAWKFTW
jgi:serine/threonine protein kinase